MKWSILNKIKLISGHKSLSEPSNPIYVHPDSPNYGNFWTKDSISFDKVKLTHKSSTSKNQVLINSLCKYEPHIHIVKVLPGSGSGSGGQKQIIVKSFRFPVTQFIAVTAYQVTNYWPVKYIL